MNTDTPLNHLKSIGFNQLKQAWPRTTISLLLIALLAWQTAHLTWLFLTEPTDITVMQAQKYIPLATPLWQHLFPTPSHSTQTDTGEAFATAEVVQNWQLLGILIDQGIKLALIQQGSSGPTAWLTEQQLTMQGVKVEQIGANYVRLLTKQNLKTLTLLKTDDVSDEAITTSRTTNASPVSLSDLHQQVQQNPTLAMQWLTLIPQFENGALTGVLVQPKQGHEAIFAQLGFSAGDKLIALNGQPMAEWMSNLSSLPKLLNSNNAQVSVLRAGKEKEWSITW